MSDRTDGRSPIAHRRVCDETQSLAEEGVGPGDVLAAFHSPMCDPCSDADFLRTDRSQDLEITETGHGCDVEKIAWCGQTHIENRDEALASGKDLASVTSSGEEVESFVNCRRPVDLER